MQTIATFRATTLAETREQLQDHVRRQPGDVPSRLALFQLLCVLGQWTRARTQLVALSELDVGWRMHAIGFEAVLACEKFRADVFAGARTPLVLGEPPAWLGELVQALALLVRRAWAPAAELRRRALDAAPDVAGCIDGSATFASLTDADSRLGPVLEAYVDGKYFWVPYERIARIEFEPPAEVLDLVWSRARFTWRSGGVSHGYVPVRYPATELEPDDATRCARVTRWTEAPEETFLGLGQRLVATDRGDFPLLEMRNIEFAISAPEEAGHA